jgi:hypothetical protein
VTKLRYLDYLFAAAAKLDLLRCVLCIEKL